MNSTDLEAARAVVFRFLGYSARSSAEIDRRLERGGFEPIVRQAIIDELTESGHLNDGKFAADWIGDRADRKRYGKSRLAAELSRRGVETEAIKDAIGEISEEDEVRRAIEIANSKMPVCSSPDGDPKNAAAADNKLCQYLQRRGFGWQVIKQVLKDRSENSSLLS
jgi:regulatory protein